MWSNVYKESTESHSVDNSGSALQLAFGSLRETAAMDKILGALLAEAVVSGLQEEALSGVLLKCLLCHPLLHLSSFRWHTASSIHIVRSSVSLTFDSKHWGMCQPSLWNLTYKCVFEDRDPRMLAKQKSCDGSISPCPWQFKAEQQVLKPFLYWFPASVQIPLAREAVPAYNSYSVCRQAVSSDTCSATSCRTTSN